MCTLYTVSYTDPAMWKSIDELARKIQASGNFAYLKVCVYACMYMQFTYVYILYI